ncbi:MAG: VanW family protein [Clostridia bacterium]|nr:VanW family protein [Bacilli bacterium]MBR3324789.1 VanW family protein [Clostridia bacterium]
MNSILVVNKGDELTKEEESYFEDAKRIVKSDNFSPKKSKKKKVGIITLIVFLLLALLFCTIFALINIGSNKIQKNIFIMGLDVSDLTQEEAKKELSEYLSDRITTDIILKHNEELYTFVPSEMQFNYDINSVIEDAYTIGRNGNIFENNFEILNQYFKETKLLPKVSINQELLKEYEPKLNENFQDGIKQPQYNMNDNKLIITAGQDGVTVDSETLKNRIFNKMLLENYNTDPIDVPVISGKCEPVNVEAAHNTIYKEPVNASFTKDPYSITAAANGIDFAISLDEAKSIITGDKKEYEIPLKVLRPTVSNDDLGIDAFPDELASYSTNYSSSGASRSNNIALATSKINGTVLMPGETFSYNGIVGRRTKEAGFQEAGAYSNGQVVNEVGGGICQVSSTLYNAVLRSNLEVTDRHNHMFQVNYCPIGTDATVSWGAPDFKFKNNRNYAIKIVAETAGKNVNISIYGLRQENDYEVEIESYRTGTVGFKTTYTTDSSLASGATKVIQGGSNGSTSITYKILKKDGEVISKDVISQDTYSPHNKIVARGA